MATSGTLNVVCHGTIVSIVNQDGSIDLWMPKVDSKWDHRWQAGTWAGNGLDSLQPGAEYNLTGLKSGDGLQRFNPAVNVCVDSAGPAVSDPQDFRHVHLPPPKSISSVNIVPISPADTFDNPDDPRVKDLRQVALLNVLSYDCDNLESVRLLAGGDSEPFSWIPHVVTNGTAQAVNLHVFAEPWTFKAPPGVTAPFNVLVNTVAAAKGLTMKPAPKGESSFTDIDPGGPIPGLPEPEKLALSQHAHFQRAGVLHNEDHPINCGGLIGQSGPAGAAVGSALAARTAAKAFAFLRNPAPKVIADPHVFVIHWGSKHPDPQVDDKVKQTLKLAVHHIRTGGVRRQRPAVPGFVRQFEWQQEEGE